MKRLALNLVIFLLLYVAIDHLLAALLKQGIDRYYGFDRDAKILVVGHSRAVHGIDGAILEQMTKKPVAKYTIQGTTLADHSMMFRHYVSEHPKSVQVAVYVVDDFLFSKGLGSNQYRLFYPFMDNEIVDRYINSYSPSAEDYLAHKLVKLNRFSEGTVQNTARLGFLGRTEQSPRAKANLEEVKRKIASINLGEQKKIIPGNIDRFLDIVQFLRSRNIKVLMIYMPFIDLVSDQNRETRLQTTEILREVASKDSGITLIETADALSRRHDLFIDATHPNRAGQELYTRIIAERISSREN